MKYIIIIIIFFSLLQSFAGEKENKEVKKSISQAITLLETDKTKEFLQTFISPQDLKKRELTIDEKFIDWFNKNKKDEVLKLFKIVKKNLNQKSQKKK